MKKSTIALMLLLVVAFAVTAVAADRSITVTKPMIVNGKTIAPGDYTLRFDVNGDKAAVKILQNNKVVLETTAKVVEAAFPAANDAILRVNNTNGTTTLTEIQTANKKQVIRLEGSDTAVGK